MANRKLERLCLAHYDLDTGQEAMRLACDGYVLTQEQPMNERSGLVSRMRRAALCVVSNVAEGVSRGRGAAFGRYRTVARESLIEVDSQVWTAPELGLCKPSSAMPDHMATCFKSINGLMTARGRR